MREIDVTMTHEEACIETQVEMLKDLGGFAAAIAMLEKGVVQDEV